MAQPISAYLQNVNTENSKATYSAVIADYLPTSSATDIVTLTGAAGKTITVTNIRISATATAASNADVYLYKRTTANTSGTSSSTAIVQHDSQDPVPSGVVKQYSANPSGLGTGVLLRGDRVAFPGATTSNGSATIWDFGNRASKAPKLHSASEFFAINFGASSPPSGTSMYLTIEWTEE